MNRHYQQSAPQVKVAVYAATQSANSQSHLLQGFAVLFAVLLLWGNLLLG